MIKENSAKVRKDLSFMGTYGVRGVGYNVEHLRFQIRRELGLTRIWPVVIVGAGNLGSALARYGGFDPNGFSIIGIYDNDPAKTAFMPNCPMSSRFSGTKTPRPPRRIAMDERLAKPHSEKVTTA